MSTYRILYIDEQSTARQKFEDLADVDFEVQTEHPLPSKISMMNFIRNQKFDALVVDYGLMKDDPSIKYTGDYIVNKIAEEREDFPALILTQSISQDQDVDDKVPSTKILLKTDLDLNNPEPFKRKIKSYIKYYQSENVRLSKQLSSLVNKRRKNHGRLSDADIEKLKYLDDKIERRLHGKRQFPKLLKDSSNMKDLKEIISAAKKYLVKKTK